MRKSLSSAALVAALILGGTTFCLAQEINVAGVYRCDGTNPDGTKYRGTVEIVRTDDTYRLRWSNARGTSSLGVGIIRGDVLAVSFFTGTNTGVVLYRIQKGPRLVGEWSVLGDDGQVYPETLTKVGMDAFQNPSADPPTARAGDSDAAVLTTSPR